MKVKLLLLVFALAFAVPSFADVFDIDFAGTTAGGTFTFKTGQGMNIPIDTVTVYDNGVAETPITGITGVVLDFSVQPNHVGQDPGTVSIWDGTIELFSGSGTFDVEKNGVGGYKVSGDGSSWSNPALLAALGITAVPEGTFTGFSSTIGRPKNGVYSVVSTDFTNTITPEPASMLLMGSFLSLAGGLLSRKKRA